MNVILDLLVAELTPNKKKKQAEDIKVKIDELKAMLKAHPELWASITDALGHAPNIGWSGPY